MNGMDSDVILGWDIGGAHVKVAALARDELYEVAQHPCPLWRGIAGLEDVVDRILRQVPARRVWHAVTMTGELADSFSERNDGVRQILGALASRIPPECLHVFAGGEGLLAFKGLDDGHYPSIASANWLASSVYAAKAVDSGVLIDIGSTTTDLVLVGAGRVRAKGFSDYQRLITGEMVYTGIVRTPIAALVNRVPFEGQRVPLMAEIFATTADVYRLTGELPEAYDQWPAADGAEKTREASARRLARMIGRDLKSAPLESWAGLAFFCRERQLRTIQDGLMRQLARIPRDLKLVIIGAGIGRYLAKDLGARTGLEYRDFSSMVDRGAVVPGVAECAPAVSLAMLLAEQLNR